MARTRIPLDVDAPVTSFLTGSELTQYALAKAAGKPAATVSSAARYGQGVRLRTLVELLSAAGYDVEITATKRTSGATSKKS